METTAKKLNVGIIVAAVVALAGVAVWIYQLSNGLGITGMSNGNSWGLYITCFMFFVGMSAGGLIVASSASVFHITEYKKVALPAVIVSTAAIVVAAMFVLVDLGGIQRVWMLFTSPNFASPLLWDVIIITVYLVIDILYMIWLAKGDGRKVEILGRVALPVAILVHSVTAWIFGLQIAKEGWYTAILAPIFVASALDSGMALLLCALAWLRKK
ncbi:MAG: polysulfide reductase NrfD, partial [Eggerthellaceae bacterium]|nr:polysulfide reductase NrfD [Eggerthellaceae bacterium]